MPSDAFQKYQQAGLQKEKQIPEKSSFENELSNLINKYSRENASGTPDFILAAYLAGSLEVFNATIQLRSEWRNERIDKTFDVEYEESVPVTIFDGNGGPGNQIGTAKLTVWPGETMTHGRVMKLMPVFEDRTPVDTSDVGEDVRDD